MGLFSRKTLASILSGFEKTIIDLEKHIENKIVEKFDLVTHQSFVAAAIKEAEDEAEKAERVLKKLRELLK